MANNEHLLNSKQMASFVADGYLRFDGLVPEALNHAAMREMEAGVKGAAAGTPLAQLYPAPSAIGEIMRLPQIQGIIHSLVGPGPLFDHHAIHTRQANEAQSQHLHGDAVIDTRTNFDIQLMYYPHDVPLEMGGTVLVPGSHLRRINESDIGRYQNMRGQIPMVCEGGTILALHHGIWHCGRRNQTERVRYMFKIRLTQLCASFGSGTPATCTTPKLPRFLADVSRGMNGHPAARDYEPQQAVALPHWRRNL